MHTHIQVLRTRLRKRVPRHISLAVLGLAVMAVHAFIVLPVLRSLV